MNLQGINGKLIAVQEAGTDQAVTVCCRTDPKQPGPWEDIVEEPHPEYGSDVIALKCQGRYASAQPDGSLQWNRTWVRAWELFRGVHDGASRGYLSVAFNTFLCCDLGRPMTTPDWSGHQVVCDRPVCGPYEHFAAVGGARYPLVGRVYTQNGAWYDATGPVPLFLHHDFPAVLMDEIDPGEADRAADALARVGSGARIMVRVSKDVGAPPLVPADYWYGRAIDDACWRAHLIPTLDRYAQRGLKACLTMGAYLGDANAYRAFWAEVGDLIVSSGHQQTVGPVEFYNENNMNSPWKNEPQTGYAIAKECMQKFKATVGCIVTGGSWGDADTLIPSADGMDAFDVHGNRDMPDAIHHIHTSWNDAVFHGGYRRQVWRGEEPGDNSPYPENRNGQPRNLGGDVFTGCDDPELEFMVMAQAQFTGQGQAWLNGPGVRHFVPLDSTGYGFRELPELLHTFIPRDVGLWRGPNPSWRTPGAFGDADKRFLYSGLSEWNQIGNPPFPIARWQAIGPYGVTDEGDGPIVIADKNWKGRLIVGERA